MTAICRLRPGGDATRAKILAAIRDLSARSGYPPTLREICATAGLSGPGQLTHHLHILADDGHIEWKPRKSRTLRLIGET